MIVLRLDKDESILAVMRATETDRYLAVKDLKINGLTNEMAYELKEAGLLHYKNGAIHGPDAPHTDGYRRTVAGTKWLQDYALQVKMQKLTQAILTLTRVIVGITVFQGILAVVSFFR